MPKTFVKLAIHKVGDGKLALELMNFPTSKFGPVICSLHYICTPAIIHKSNGTFQKKASKYPPSRDTKSKEIDNKFQKQAHKSDGVFWEKLVYTLPSRDTKSKKNWQQISGASPWRL